MCRIGETVQAQSEWTTSTLENRKVEIVGTNLALSDAFGHAETVLE